MQVQWWGTNLFELFTLTGSGDTKTSLSHPLVLSSPRAAFQNFHNIEFIFFYLTGKWGSGKRAGSFSFSLPGKQLFFSERLKGWNEGIQFAGLVSSYTQKLT